MDCNGTDLLFFLQWTTQIVKITRQEATICNRRLLVVSPETEIINRQMNVHITKNKIRLGLKDLINN